MGLAISYHFNLNSSSISQAKDKVIALHQCALDLPFVEVSELMEIMGSDCLFKEKDPLLALKICALSPEELMNNLFNGTDETKCSYLIGFSTLPGHGCAKASFGLATQSTTGNNKNWKWNAFCKTSYANNSEYGGIENFLKCHLGLIKILDTAQQLGIIDLVVDPSGYWESRNQSALVEIISSETVMMAAIMGSIKDSFESKGYKTVAPILEDPNFEYLEAKGNLME
jgi:hypothetical protein